MYQSYLMRALAFLLVKSLSPVGLTMLQMRQEGGTGSLRGNGLSVEVDVDLPAMAGAHAVALEGGVKVDEELELAHMVCSQRGGGELGQRVRLQVWSWTWRGS